MGKRQQIDHYELQCERPAKSRKVSESSEPQPAEEFEEEEEEEIKNEFVLTKEIADSAVLTDITGSFWRIGKPVGKGSFGEIFLASDQINQPVDCNTAKYVAKIEPHSNGPLFVEIHCLLNVTKRNEDEELPAGIPEYIASGSHYFTDSRYRFLVLPRFKCDLHSIIKNGRLSEAHFLVASQQIIDVLQNLHIKGYVHSDIKAENIMIGLCQNFQSSQQMAKHWETPIKSSNNGNHNKKKPAKEAPKEPLNILYGGSNPIRSCRGGNQDNNLYQDMLRSHYLRPSRSVSYVQNLYSDDDDDDGDSVSEEIPAVVSPRKYEMDDDFQCKVKIAQVPKRRGRPRKFELPNPEPVIEPPPKKKRGRKAKNQATSQDQEDSDCEDNVYLIDYGLATKYLDTYGEHRPFCQDQRRAHDGTLEFTSRDAHFGAHSRRSDLECLGFNLIYWSQGYLPWKDENMQLQEPEHVHRLKEIFMTDVREMMKLFYGKDVPKMLMDFMCYVGELAFEEDPDYDYLKGLFANELQSQFGDQEITLNLKQVREACEPLDKDTTETELMMETIKDLKTVRKLGFLTENSSDPDQPVVQVNPTPSHNKFSPKNLRSKVEKVKGRKSKRASAAATQKESTNQKLKNGKRLSIVDIVNMDPDLIARDRAEKEYDRIEEKQNDQTPQRYKGRPTYAILEIENRLKIRNSGLHETEEKKEVIKGYNKPMMDVLRKIQFTIEQDMEKDQPSDEESEQEVEEPAPTPTRKITRGRPRKIVETNTRRRGRSTRRVQIDVGPEVIDNSEPEIEEEEEEVEEEIVVEEMVEPSPKVTRSRSRKSKYYRDNEFIVQTDESSCSSTSTVATASSRSTTSSKNIRNTRRTKGVSESNSNSSGKVTRKQTKSRSTSRSTWCGQNSEPEEEIEDNDNDYEEEASINEGSEEEQDAESGVVDEDLGSTSDFYESSNEEQMEDDDAEDSDDGSIYIKYSPLKTRHARRNASNFNLRGRRIFNDKDFRSLTVTRG